MEYFYDYALLNRILQLSWKTLYRKHISIWGCDEKIFCCASNISFWWCALKNFLWLEFTTWWNDKYLNRCICSCWVNKSVSTPEINKTLKSSWLIYIKKKMILRGQVSWWISEMPTLRLPTVGNSEVGISELTHHQKCLPQLYCIFLLFFSYFYGLLV